MKKKNIVCRGQRVECSPETQLASCCSCNRNLLESLRKPDLRFLEEEEDEEEEEEERNARRRTI